jgi:preprotein translocase subunit SecA
MKILKLILESKVLLYHHQVLERAEQIFQLENLYDLKHVTLVHHINNALRANILCLEIKNMWLIIMKF